MFSATGWRIGWLIGPSWIIQPTLAATTRIVFCSNSPMQEAVAAGLEQATKRGFVKTQCDEYVERRAILAEAFDRLGARYTLPEGTYFLLLVSISITLKIRSISR
jgi:kynurenine aminotransferase